MHLYIGACDKGVNMSSRAPVRFERECIYVHIALAE